MKNKNYFSLLSLISIIIIILSRPIYPFVKAISNSQSPQIILVLGGDVDREVAGMKIAKVLGLPLLISGGSNPEYSNWLIQKENLSPNLVKRDYRAEDTLTNFTYIVDELSEENINHILLITSEYHIKRAKVVGQIISGSRGIKLTSLSIPCPSDCKYEGMRKRNIDLLRAITWVATGKDLKQVLQKTINYKLKY